jgi:hypothetical protein
MSIVKKIKSLGYKKVSTNVYQKKRCGVKATVVLNKTHTRLFMYHLKNFSDTYNKNTFNEFNIELKHLEEGI